MPSSSSSIARRSLLRIAALLAAVPLCTAAYADKPWPTARPITWIVGYVPGGSVDVLTRAFAKSMSEQIGQAIVVDNVPGASGALALQQAANRTLETGVARGRVSDSYSYLQAVGATNSGQPAGNVTIDNWLECDGSRTASFDGTCGSNQQSGRYISVKITGTHKPSFNYNGLARRFGNTTLGGDVAIAGFAAVRIQ